MNRLILSAIVMASATVSTSALAAVTYKVTLEEPGVVNTTTGFDYVGVETFDGPSRIVGSGQSFQTTFIPENGENSAIIGTYQDLRIMPSGVYGGAGGSQYAVAGLGTGNNEYSLTFSQTGANGLNYFGYWLSALDGGNNVRFYSGDELLFTFSAQDAFNEIASMPGSNYIGKPGDPGVGENIDEPYAFLNFYLQGGTFDRVVFDQNARPASGYESDNHTVGYYHTQTGTPITPGVPEPATWAMMLLGFGVVGGAMRSRAKSMKRKVSYT